MDMKRGINKQQGMAAIMVTMILAVVISIIVIGFAQVVRREQRNSLDNQLSTQAYYAAESGVNLAQSVLKADPTLTDKPDCAATGPFADKYDIGENAEITCLLISSKLSSLEYQKVDMHSVPMYVKADAGTVDRLYISWQASSGSSSVAGCPAAPGSFGSSWSCAQPLLRLDLVPDNGASDPASVANSQYTAFLYPTTSGGGLVSYAANSKNTVVAAKCTASTGALNPRICTMTIQGLGQQAYAARVMSIYGDSDVTVFATDPSNVRRTLVEGQVLIDVTAKASDVLKRVQARTSLTAPIPDFGITAAGGGVCKRYQKVGDTISIDDAVAYPACAIP